MKYIMIWYDAAGMEIDRSSPMDLGAWFGVPFGALGCKIVQYIEASGGIVFPKMGASNA
jgi:hypothetical protein